MGNRSISPDIKRRALSLWQEGWSIDDVCRIFRVSRASLYRWNAIFQEHGDVVKPPSLILGAPRKIGIAAITAIREIYENHPDTYLDELQWFLRVLHGITVSVSTLRDTLQKLGLSYEKLKKLAKERDDHLRAEWKTMLAEEFSGDAFEFVVVDETSKNEHEILRRYGRAPVGQDTEWQEACARYSMVAAITLEGCLAADIVEGSFDGDLFPDFLLNQVLPQMNHYPDKQSVLVLDNCRFRHNDIVYEACKGAGIMLLYLPPFSPDLTPITESFSTLKAYLRRFKDKLRVDDDPIGALHDVTAYITPEMCVEWFRHAGYLFDE